MRAELSVTFGMTGDLTSGDKQFHRNVDRKPRPFAKAEAPAPTLPV